MIEVQHLQADPAGIETAATLLRDGDLVAFPTETVYGLGGDASNGRAVAGIFAAKGRPNFNPLIVHLPSAAAAWRQVEPNPIAEQLATAFWPGALTLVLPRRPTCRISELVSAGLPTLAVRVPSHPVAQRLLESADRPVAAPSANRSGRVSPTRAAHVLAELDGRIAAVLDGGTCGLGLESTVVGFERGAPVILRPGGITVEMIEEILPLAKQDGRTDDLKPSAPGQLSAHYAPAKAMRLDAEHVGEHEAVLAFGKPPAGHDGPLLNLSPSGDLAEAAANLFHMLRELDADEARSIAVQPIPDKDIGRAINDRLRRAAHDNGS